MIGYSGRDDSVMDTLDEAVSLEGALPSGLWWVARPESQLLPRVVSLLERAAASGIEVCIVDSENFDELAGDIEREVNLTTPLHKHVRLTQLRPLVEPVTLPESRATQFPAIRYSALELLNLPEVAREVIIDKPLTTAEARQLIRNTDNAWATVTSHGRRLVAFGSDDDIMRVFASVGGKIAGTMRLNPIDQSSDLGLVYEALVKAITRRRPLQRGSQTAASRPMKPWLRQSLDADHYDRSYDVVGTQLSYGHRTWIDVMISHRNTASC